jgi:hypothetical protein
MSVAASPYEGEATITISMPLSYGRPAGLQFGFLRAYPLEATGTWRYCPGQVTEEGRLQVVVPPLDCYAPPPLPDARVSIGGMELAFDVPPRVVSDRFMVPCRALAEALGCNVAWDCQNARVTLSKEDKIIVLDIGGNVALVNGVEPSRCPFSLTVTAPLFRCGLSARRSGQKAQGRPPARPTFRTHRHHSVGLAATYSPR